MVQLLWKMFEQSGQISSYLFYKAMADIEEDEPERENIPEMNGAVSAVPLQAMNREA